MGNCIYCGNKAGFLSKRHRECEAKNKSGWKEMITLSRETALGTKNLDALTPALSRIAESSFVAERRVQDAMVAGWKEAVEKFLDDDLLEEHEEHKLLQFIKRFGLSQVDLEAGENSYSKVVKAGVLRDIMNGILPDRIKADSPLPFNFQKDEKLVWAFQGVQYLTDKTRRQYVGGYQGMSVRVAKGLYLRTGSFRGHPVEHTERVYVDTGLLGATNKHLYFAGTGKSFRIAYSKVVSFEPFSDGIGVMRDTATAKPQIFVTGDGWFTYNLVTNLSRL